MIGRLRGLVWEVLEHSVVLDVNGVGYAVTLSPRIRFTVGESVELFIHTQVREDELRLFGFLDVAERAVFMALLAVPNIGPSKAIQILAAPIEELLESIAEKNVTQLARLPGVGKKTAERIVLDLADKAQDLRAEFSLARDLESTKSGNAKTLKSGVVSGTKREQDLVSALVNLGFKEGAVRDVVQKMDIRQNDKSLEVLLREGLGQLTKPS